MIKTWVLHAKNVEMYDLTYYTSNKPVYKTLQIRILWEENK